MISKSAFPTIRVFKWESRRIVPNSGVEIQSELGSEIANVFASLSSLAI